MICSWAARCLSDILQLNAQFSNIFACFRSAWMVGWLVGCTESLKMFVINCFLRLLIERILKGLLNERPGIFIPEDMGFLAKMKLGFNKRQSLNIELKGEIKRITGIN